MIFKVSELRDAGDFVKGRLAWDILHATANHNCVVPNTIDLSDATHLKPYSLAALFALNLRASTSVKLILPDDSECREHLERLGFCCPDEASHVARKTNVRIRQLTDGPGSFSSDAMDVWENEVGSLPAGLKPQLAVHLDEVISNAIQHADSPIGCVVVGQAFPKTHKVEVAVLDLGQTILGHLSKHPAFRHLKSDRDAILEATKDAVTGAIGTANSGVGLYDLRTFCEGGYGELSIISGSSIVVFKQGESPVFHDFRGLGFRGTLVNTLFLTDAPLTLDQPTEIVF